MQDRDYVTINVDMTNPKELKLIINGKDEQLFKNKIFKKPLLYKGKYYCIIEDKYHIHKLVRTRSKIRRK